MENTKLKQLILKVLKADERLWNEDKTELNQTLLLDLVEKIDEKVIDLLLQEKDLREKFFVKIKDVYVFKTNEFRFFIEENKIDNSYTAYKNRIGLTDGKRFLKDTNDVVLDWPYKDCVLEGGQSTEEGTDTYFEYNEKTEQYEQKQEKRKEIFFNQVLAHDEIDRLFDEKALVNWKRYTKDGEIPLFEGWTAKQDGVDNIPSWQKKSLFPYWDLPKNKELNQRAKELRTQGILSEVLFWKAFKDKEKIKGYDIDRQVIIGNFIVDFFIAELGLVVEIDGSSHDNKQEYDNERQAFLEGLNLQVLRYADSEVKKNIDGIHKDFLRNIEIREEELRRNHPVNPVGLPHIKRGASTPSNASHLPPLKRGIDGTIKENLIIKGNNLLALHSLKKQFAGKIKLIYIDPPYNTGGDANIFTYNNTFNHSTWLTFMKNRLEAGKQLLRDDGFIAIAIDHEELFYLGVLADEIFDRENRVGIVTVLHNPKGRNQAKFFSGNSDFMLIYAKNIKNANFRDVAISEDVKKSFNERDDKGAYRYEPYMRARTVWSREKRPKNWYPIYVSQDLKIITHKKKDGYHELYPITNDGKEMAWKNVEETFIDLNKDDYFLAKNENRKIRLYHKYREQQVFKNVWTDKKYQSEFQGTNLLKKIFGENKFSYPKSLYTVLDTLKIMTSDDDIILDFHAGSGTTGHATLALNKEDGGNRKFILVEQLDEHIEICNERNQKVLAQENIDDSFIYFELAKWNETAKEKILACESLDELITFFDEMYEIYFLNYNLKIKEFREKVIYEKEFKDLSLDKQKEIFIAMLDNNQMYVNKTEMADKKFGISEEDQKMTEEFYKDEK